MSLYSHGIDLMFARTGLPFCLGDTRIDDPADRDGSAWGVGWTILELDAADGGALSRRWGVGCCILCGVGWLGRFDGGVGRGGARAGAGAAAARAAIRSSSAPKSSSILAMMLQQKGAHLL